MRSHFTHCDRTLQLLLKTFVDILLLRKGPENLPHSWLLLIAVLSVSLLLSMLSTRIILPDIDPRHDLTLLLAVMLMAFYYVVLYVHGYSQRFLQTGTAIMGADILLIVVYLTGFLVVSGLLDDRTALILAWLISYWSVPLQGNIIARAIQQHWGIGIAIALGAHIMLRLTYQHLTDQS